MLPTEDVHTLLEIPNNYNLQISTLQTSLIYSSPFCSTSPVYKILDQYLSKQQLKNCHEAVEIISKRWGAVFQQDIGKGRRVCQQTCASYSISEKHSVNINAATKEKEDGPLSSWEGPQRSWVSWPFLHTPSITNIILLNTTANMATLIHCYFATWSDQGEHKTRIKINNE